jgi:hypothetical protein
MSVIQDALRRKLDEQQRAATDAPRPSGATRPSPQPPPVAQQVLENDPRSLPIASVVAPYRRQAREESLSVRPRHDSYSIQLLLGAILFMLVAFFGGAVVHFLQGRNQDLRTLPTSPAPAATAPVEPAATVNTLQNPPAQPVPTASPPLAATATPGNPAQLPADAIPGAAPAVASTPDAPASVAAAPLASGWPLIRVEGVLAGATPSRSSALLNDQMIRVRQRIEGVRLLEVRTEGVLLEYQDETRFVQTGTTTEDDE